MKLLTKSELMQVQKQRLNELIEYCGNASHIARMIDLSPQAIAAWIRRGKVSKKGAIMIAEHETLGEKFDAEYLRPDLNNNIDHEKEVLRNVANNAG